MAVFPLGLAQAIQLVCEDKTIPKNIFEVLVLCELCIGLFRGGKLRPGYTGNIPWPHGLRIFIQNLLGIAATLAERGDAMARDDGLGDELAFVFAQPIEQALLFIFIPEILVIHFLHAHSGNDAGSLHKQSLCPLGHKSFGLLRVLKEQQRIATANITDFEGSLDLGWSLWF